MRHHTLPVSPTTMHWGYFSKKVAPALTLKSGDRATIETLTHHANDDYERMIADDPGAESVFHWTREQKTMARRGAGSDRRPVPPRLRRGHRRPPPDRPGRDRKCRARRHSGGPHPRHPPAPELPRLSRRTLLRLQRGGILGLSLSRPDRGAEAARGRHHLRTRHVRRAVRAGGLQLCLDAADRSRRHRASRPSIIPACGSIMRTVRRRENILPNVKVPARLHFGTMGLAPSEVRFRQLDPAELYRRQYRRLADRQGRADVLSGRRARRFLLGRRPPRRAGRQRARRHRDRDLAHRRFRVRPAQRARSRRHHPGRADPSNAGDRPAMVGLWLHLPELPGGAWPGCTDRGGQRMPASTRRCATPSASCAGS